MPAYGTPGTDDGKVVTEIIERRNESKKWLKANIWDELTEVYRGICCRTKPIYQRDDAGNETTKEDKSRTNVAMPDLSIAWRSNVARVTAQPYKLNYTGGSDERVAYSLSSLAQQQYARSDEHSHDVRLNMAAEAFGYAYMKLFYDTLGRTMQFRKALMKGNDIVYRDRQSIMRAQGAPDDEITQAVSQMGNDMSDDEVNQFMSKSGKELTVPTNVSKYEGPVCKWVYNGDLFLEPGCIALNNSDFVIEQYRETDVWFKKMTQLTYEDEEGKDVQVFDEEAVKELLAMDPDLEVRADELRDLMQTSLGKQDQEQYKFPRHLRVRKKFDVLEHHAQDEDGRTWITWVSEKYRDKPLGKMPYPWDFYGKYAYTEYVPLPDLVFHYGQSTPRLMRFLYSLHNAIIAQNFDYVSNIMKKFLLEQVGNEIANNVTDRGAFRTLTVKNMNGLQYLEEPGLPSGAFEREADIVRMMQILEPAIGGSQAGTDTNPQNGKTATTAILGAKVSDVLTRFKLDNRDIYLRELGQKKLWMNQQMQEKPWTIESKFFSKDMKEMLKEQQEQQGQQPPEWALSDRNNRTVAIRLDPFEIQEDLEVEPEAGSYLAVDDELRQNAAFKLQSAAQANPMIYDQRKVANFYLSTIPDIGDPEDYILPEPPPPPPPVKVNMSIAVKWEDLPADVQNQLLQAGQMQPSQELELQDTLKGITKLSDAADAADNLTSPEATHSFQAKQKQDQVLAKTKATDKLQ